MSFTESILVIDSFIETTRISEFIRRAVTSDFKRRGVVVGLSGGVDSALVAELCVKALGKDRVLGVLLPEAESNPVSLKYGLRQAEKLGIETVTEDITGILAPMGVYRERDARIRSIFSEFSDNCRFHITLPQNLLEKHRLNYHIITVETNTGKRETKRLSNEDWLTISACQNLKQRTRMIRLYYHAENIHYIVAGTTNRTEEEQGFYVKYGDGGADIEPIAHLYKTQVYQLAEHLGVIEQIIRRPPSPDTYSLPVTDKEFYFCLDYPILDLLLYAFSNDVPVDLASEVTGLTGEQIDRVFEDFIRKEQATWHLRQVPLSLKPV